MIERIKIPQFSSKDREDMELAGWAFESHWWVEQSPGYMKCKWCDACCTSTTGISRNFPLCLKNPLLEAVAPWIKWNRLIGDLRERIG